MLLKDVRIYLNSDEFPQVMRSDFLFRSCYISNYLTRSVRQLRLSREYKGVLVQGCSNPPASRISAERNLIVPVNFSSGDYAGLQPGEEHEFFIAMVAEGLRSCAPEFDLPLNALMGALEEFRRGDYRNEWTYQKKPIRALRAHASLLCSLDSQRFRLVLKLENKNGIVFEEEILTTKPDELLFAHRFKELAIDGNAIVVNDKFGKQLYSRPWRTLVPVPPQAQDG